MSKGLSRPIFLVYHCIAVLLDTRLRINRFGALRIDVQVNTHVVQKLEEYLPQLTDSIGSTKSQFQVEDESLLYIPVGFNFPLRRERVSADDLSRARQGHKHNLSGETCKEYCFSDATCVCLMQFYIFMTNIQIDRRGFLYMLKMYKWKITFSQVGTHYSTYLSKCYLHKFCVFLKAIFTYRLTCG